MPLLSQVLVAHTLRLELRAVVSSVSWWSAQCGVIRRTQSHRHRGTLVLLFCTAETFPWSFPSIRLLGEPLAVQEPVFLLFVDKEPGVIQRGRATHSRPFSDQMSGKKQLRDETERRAGG